MTPGRARGGCRVDRDLRRRLRAGGLAAEAVRAPERLVVDEQRLRLRTRGRVTVQRQTVLRQHRIEGDLQRQRRRNGDDGVPSRHRQLGALDDDVVSPLDEWRAPACSGGRRSPRSSATRRAIDPAPPATRFSW